MSSFLKFGSFYLHYSCLPSTIRRNAYRYSGVFLFDNRSVNQIFDRSFPAVILIVFTPPAASQSSHATLISFKTSSLAEYSDPKPTRRELKSLARWNRNTVWSFYKLGAWFFHLFLIVATNTREICKWFNWPWQNSILESVKAGARSRRREQIPRQMSLVLAWKMRVSTFRRQREQFFRKAEKQRNPVGIIYPKKSTKTSNHCNKSNTSSYWNHLCEHDQYHVNFKFPRYLWLLNLHNAKLMLLPRVF